MENQVQVGFFFNLADLMSTMEAKDMVNTGKSVMCSYVIGTLLQTSGLDTLYYFCNGQDGDNVCVQILRTLALQLLRQHQDAASLIANEFVYRTKNCGLQELRTLIPQLLAISAYTRIIIDGVDECSKRGQKAILKELQDLCLRRNSHCKILFSSRKEVHLAEKLSAKPQISLDGHEKVESDIHLFVKYKIRELRTSDATLLNTIESNLVDKANGKRIDHLLVSSLMLKFSRRNVLVGTAGCRRITKLFQ
jgi:hypothetical protein